MANGHAFSGTLPTELVICLHRRDQQANAAPGVVATRW